MTMKCARCGREGGYFVHVADREYAVMRPWCIRCLYKYGHDLEHGE